MFVPLHVPHAESRSYSICTTVHFFRSLMPIRARVAASRSGREVAWTIASSLRSAEVVGALYCLMIMASYCKTTAEPVQGGSGLQQVVLSQKCSHPLG